VTPRLQRSAFDLLSSRLHLWLDALYLKIRHKHRIVSQALMIATGVQENGEREVLGFALGASEEEAFSRKDTGTVCAAWCGGD